MLATAEAVGVVRLFAPAVLLPVQVVYPPADGWLRRLCLAILEDALACLAGKGPPSHMGSHGDVARRMREAWEWVLSDAEYLFSFTLVCTVLELDVAAVRSQVRQRVA